MGHGRGGLSVLPALALAALPKCPVCLTAYLGAFGGSLSATSWARAVSGPGAMCAGLLLAIGSLGLRARRRRSWGPFVVGIVAAVILLAGKWFPGAPGFLSLVGAALLLGATACSAGAPRAMVPRSRPVWRWSAGSRSAVQSPQKEYEVQSP